MKALEVLLGYGCNEACAFCSQDLAWRRAPGLPFPLVARELFLAAKDGYTSVCFTGGEPTLRKDLPEMLALSRKLGFEYRRVQTNGVKLAEPGFVESLQAAGANYFRVSLHGHTPEVHDALVKVPGALAKAADGLARLKERGIGVGLNFVLTAANHSVLPEFCAAFLDQGLRDFVVIYPLYEGDLVHHESAMRVSMADAAASVRRAIGEFDRRGAPRPRLLNFTPCAAPELSDQMLAWSAHSLLVVDAEHRPIDLYMASHDDRLQPSGCAACSLASECLGFKRSYLARFPDGGGLAPVKTAGVPPRSGTRILRRGGGAFALGCHELARALQPVAGQSAGEASLRVERMTVTLDADAGRIVESRTEWVEPLGEAAHA